MFQFSSSSNARLDTTSMNIQRVVRRALEITKVDFGIPKDGGMRTARRQHEMYLDPSIETNCDGYIHESHHQTGNAVDVYAYVDGKANWEKEHLAMVASAMLQAASELGVKLEWGGLWNKPDMPHFQIVE
jgi:peptidoglycan LD-endopeptidase CwlK